MTNNTNETVPTRFLSAVDKWGDRVAMRKKEYGLWHDISWNDYHDQVNSIACALMSMGLKKGDTAAIIGDNCPEWVYTDLGIQCCGAATTGVYATNAWQQVEYVIENSESRFFFVENEEQLDKWLRFKDNVPNLKKVIVWDTEGLRQFKDPMVMTFDELLETGRQVAAEHPDMFIERIRTIEPQDLSVLIYTSGTTGPPKGAMLTHRNCLWMGHAITSDNPMTDKDEIMSFLPLCHIFEQLFTVLGHIVCGHIVNFIESPDTVAENMMEISPTVGHAVPRIWEKYFSAIQIRMSDATWFKRLVFYSALKIGNKRADLKMNFKAVPFYLEALYQLAYLAVFRKLKERMGFDRLRVAISGAAPIAPEILHFYQSIGVNLIEGYGQTEGTGVTTVSRPGGVKVDRLGSQNCR
jgi:long-chain acyl-CoA synthetase